MSDTPKTDAAEYTSTEFVGDGNYVVRSSFARQLERRIAELEEENAEKDRLLRVDVDNNVLLVEKLERAEAKVKELEIELRSRLLDSRAAEEKR